jgi:hypothetical protein
MNDTLKAYEVTVQVGRRTHVWTRFAVDPVALIASAQQACGEEWPAQESVITNWREVEDPRRSMGRL